MMSTPRMQYATDVTDAQWQRIEPLLPVPRWRLDGPGRPPRDRRQIVNGLLYLNKTGCPWALLPCCFGPWKTVYDYFRRWSRQGVWSQVLDRLIKRERRLHGRVATPSAGVVDSRLGRAQEKLDCLRKYLHAYTTILSKQQWLKGYFYIDAFAGPGTLKIRRQKTDDRAQKSLIEVSDHVAKDTGEAEYISGSPRVALELERPFTDYVFIEIDKNKLNQLEELKNEYGSKDLQIHLRKQDCNNYLRKLIKETQWTEWRGVVFLDPFGMQVPWNTIVEIGKTKAIEIFINFPVGMAIQRLLKRSGQFTPKERRKIDQYFGTDEWYDLLYDYSGDLFGGDNITKVQNSGDVLVKWYRKRLKEVFGHVSTAREIQNTQGRPLYYLIFAGPNETGAKIANEVLRQGARRIR